MNCAAPVQKKSIRFRARSFVAFALAPEGPLDGWLEELDRWIESSPGFFTGRPVVLDLNASKPEAQEMRELVAQLAGRGIRVYAIEAKHVEALDPDLPPLLTGAKEATIEVEKPGRGAKAASAKGSGQQPAPPGSLIVRSPIRSGQSIYQPHGDVIVLGSAGSGSEIIAGGSVHVYGTLRGRAFAGASGNAEARIFCQRNEAELLAVDGWYRTAEDMDPLSRGKPVQAFLENGVVQVVALNR